MKVVFNGLHERRSGGSGCKCRGRSDKVTFLSSKTYILPSGKVLTFSMDVPMEVSERDAAFLLSYSYTDPNGQTRNVFSEVNDGE